MIFSEKYEQLEDIEKYPDVRFVIINGGRGTGKSTFVSHFQHNLSFLSDHVILNTRFTMSSAKDSVIAEMAKTIEDRGSESLFKGVNNTIINTVTGSKIIFKGIKAGSLTQTANLKGITDLNVWIVDEAEELTDENTFDDANHSIRRKGYQNLVILILNSHNITKEHFIYQTFYEDRGVNWTFNGIKENVMYIHTTFLDNWENLSNSIKQEIKFLKKHHDKYKNGNLLDIPKNFVKYINKYRYNFLGKLRTKAEGVIFKNWTFGTFAKHLPYVFASDIGATDPDTLIKIAIDSRYKKLYIDEKFYITEQSNIDFIKNIKKHVKYSEILIIDSSAKKTILDTKKAGFNVRKSKKYAGSVVAGIKKMYDYDIIITENSKNVAKELNHYVWLDRYGEVPIDKYNHTIDAVRYGLEYLTKYY